MKAENKPVGIPRTFEPRPNPLMTGPPIYQGSTGKVLSTPAINYNTSSNINTIYTNKGNAQTQNVILRYSGFTICKWW